MSRKDMLDAITAEKRMASMIFLEVWDNPGYMPDPVADVFRNAVVAAAMEICHETGDVESYIQFCADTIRNWLLWTEVKGLTWERNSPTPLIVESDKPCVFCGCVPEKDRKP